jgi:hypothetical protein
MSEFGTRYCRKCLMRDMSGEEEFFADLRSYIDAIPEEERTPSERYEQRLDTCRQCDNLLQGMCKACGCYVELRAAKEAGGCPYHHW